MFDEDQYTLELREQEGAPIILCNSYSDFLAKIRARLDNVVGYFEVRLTLDGTVSPWIMLNRGDLYIVGLAGKKLKNIEYTDADLKISRDGFLNAIFAANKVVTKHAGIDFNMADCKTLSFFIAEAARFEIVAHACYVKLNDPSCDSSWATWAPLLKSWKKLSSLASVHVAIQSGGLVAPIRIDASQAMIYDLASPAAATNHATLALSQLHQEFESAYLALEDSSYTAKRLSC